MNAKPSVPSEQATVEAILDHLKGQLSASRQGNAQVFARAFFKRVPAEDLAARSSTAWCAVLTGLLATGMVTGTLRPWNPPPGSAPTC